MIGTPSQYSKLKVIGLHSPVKLENGDYFMNIKNDKTIVGSLFVKKYKNSFIIRDVFVLEEERGKGYGRKLLTDILQFLKPKNKEIYLYVEPTIPAIILYKKIGFKFIKKGAYGDKYQFTT